MAEVKYELKEQGEILYALCPNCSKMYATADGKGVPQDVPNKCKRCDGPMDKTAALKFANANAERDHDPNLAKQGAKLRAEGVAV